MHILSPVNKNLKNVQVTYTFLFIINEEQLCYISLLYLKIPKKLFNSK